MINKITIKNSVKIIDNKVVMKKKKKSLDDTYNYLLSRSFDYFPSIVKEDNDYIYYKYIDDLYEPKEQKMNDLVHLVYTESAIRGAVDKLLSNLKKNAVKTIDKEIQNFSSIEKLKYEYGVEKNVVLSIENIEKIY